MICSRSYTVNGYRVSVGYHDDLPDEVIAEGRRNGCLSVPDEVIRHERKPLLADEIKPMPEPSRKRRGRPRKSDAE